MKAIFIGTYHEATAVIAVTGSTVSECYEAGINQAIERLTPSFEGDIPEYVGRNISGALYVPDNQLTFDGIGEYLEHPNTRYFDRWFWRVK